MAMQQTNPNELGIVIIGRNEGERLVRCLASVAGFGGRVVYVDSGSTDQSISAAQAAGAQVVELDMSKPFTAARARNAGMAALKLLAEDKQSADATPPDFVQFVDGDCEIQHGWLDLGSAFLHNNPNVAVVSGRLRERHPEVSLYNALCDEEWDVPVGENKACGGIAMMRITALAQTTLFNDNMIAGEEPELCLRLRRQGWKIWRIADEMALHDAAMTSFGQFWKRMRRGGFAYGLWTDMYYPDPERPGAKSLQRALVWGAFIPLVVLLSVIIFGSFGLWLALIYPAQMVRLAFRKARHPFPYRMALLNILSKFAEVQGFAEFYLRKWRRKSTGIIEHK